MGTGAAENNLRWLDQPHSGLEETYTDRFGRVHTRTVRYTDVRCTPLVLAETVAPGLFHTAFALEGFHFCDRIDLYAVGDAQETLLVDTAHPDLCGYTFLDQLIEAAGCSWDDASVFLTHLHDDHAGNVDYCVHQGIQTVYRGSCQPFSPLAVKELLHITGASRANDTALDDFAGFLLGEGNPLFGLEPPLLEADEGTAFDVAGYRLEVLNTPGHTVEHRCLLEPERGILFAGDHLVFGAPGVMQLRPGQHLLHNYLASLADLRKRGLRTVLMSHHEALIGTDAINALIDRILQAHRHPLEKTLAILHEKGPLTVYGTTAAYESKRSGGLASQPSAMRVRRMATMFGYLDYLVDAGKLRRHADDEGVYWYETRTNSYTDAGACAASRG